MSAFLRTSQFAVLCLVALFASSGTSFAASSIKVVVNGDIITSYEIAQRARLLPLFGGKGGEKAAIEELIDDRVKAQEARRRGVQISDKQVDGAYANLGQEKKLSPKQLDQALGQMGIASRTMKTWIKSQMIWQQLVQAKVRRDGQVKSTDIMSAMLEKGRPDAITVTEYRLQQIIFVVPSGSSSSVVAQRKREAEGFRMRFPGCDGSLALAKSLKGVVVRDAGRRDSTQLRGAQGEAIKETAEGKTTRPIQSDNGIELYAVCAKRDFQSDAGARAEVESKLRLEQSKELGKDYLKQLRDAAVVQYR